MKQVIGKIVVSWKSSYYNVTIVEHRLDMDMMEMMEIIEVNGDIFFLIASDITFTNRTINPS